MHCSGNLAGKVAGWGRSRLSRGGAMSEEEIFHGALACEPEGRAAYLDRACAGNPGMRA